LKHLLALFRLAYIGLTIQYLTAQSAQMFKGICDLLFRSYPTDRQIKSFPGKTLRDPKPDAPAAASNKRNPSHHFSFRQD
jgi:hypothetical protein